MSRRHSAARRTHGSSPLNSNAHSFCPARDRRALESLPSTNWSPAEESDRMIKVLSDMPVGVLGLEAIDDVEEEDYRNVLVPAVEAAIAEHGKVRLVYVLGPEFD